MRQNPQDLSIYIHIPFCKTICVYCGFLTYANKEKRIDDYVIALIQEISAKSRRFKERSIVSIYFGGGTPSLIDTKKTGAILDEIRKRFRVSKNAEITIECNPESVTAEKMGLYKRYGINRISLGIQSLNRETLRRVARPHTPEDAKNALKTIKDAGFGNFGTDYIIGLPYQTLQSFKSETNKILTHKPPHLSFYFLSPDTKKIDLIAKDCPDEEDQVKMYRWLAGRLKKAGYAHYEVSNYALPGYECRHNLRYWQQREYLGFGLGAHSFINNECIVNREDFEEYVKNPLTEGEKFVLDPELQRLDYIMLHLRTSDGLDLEDYEKKFGNDEDILKKSAPWLRTGMLKKHGKTISATDKGFLFLDRITQDLF